MSGATATYAIHRESARRRGIAFDLTFEQWWALWEPYWERRGRSGESMQMCRLRDEGGYTMGNVRIDTQRANAAEQGVVRRVKRASSAFQSRPRTPVDPPAADWLWRRDAFKPYTEDDDDA